MASGAAIPSVGHGASGARKHPAEVTGASATTRCRDRSRPSGWVVGVAQVAPVGHPHLRQVEQGDDVVARHQHAVEGAHGGGEVLRLARLQQGLDHGVGGGVLDARIVERALDGGGPAAPAVDLLVAGRQRGAPGPLDHVEVEALEARPVLRRVDLADAQADAEPLQRAGVAQHHPLLLAGLGQELEGEGHAALDEAAAFELVAGLGEQLEGGAQVGAVVAAAVGDGQAERCRRAPRA